jgi:putative ATP-dependent endonuclease of OLD family
LGRGASDRLYINRWIELYAKARIKEGTHYQCVFYGGRLLAHLAADDPEIDTDEVVKILRLNRNAILVVDSDKRSVDDELNSTKLRLINEIENFRGFVWVTAGKEIENYLALSAIKALFEAASEPPVQYQDFGKYLDTLKEGAVLVFAGTRCFSRRA